MKNINLKYHDYISSYNFAMQSNFVYSEVLTWNQFNQLKLTNVNIINKNDNLVFYKKNKLTIKENDIIFCHLGMVKNLLYQLAKFNNYRNLTLITSQTDNPVDSRIFSLKTNNISRWFSINIDYEHEILKPLPLGLSNEYSPKNPDANDFIKLNKNPEIEKTQKMYINFRENTNVGERSNLLVQFQNEDWVTFDNPNLEIEAYLNNLKTNQFTLCPWGNGVDTHRLWETLYAGSVPITKYHHTYSTANRLPVLFVNHYEEINKMLLNDFVASSKNIEFDYKKLSMDSWVRDIKAKDHISNLEVQTVTESSYFIIKTLGIVRIKNFYEKYRKRIIFQFRKLKKLPKIIREIILK